MRRYQPTREETDQEALKSHIRGVEEDRYALGNLVRDKRDGKMLFVDQELKKIMEGFKQAF